MVVLNLAHIKGRRLKFGTPLIFPNIYIKMGNSFARQEAVCFSQHDKEPQIRESKLQEAKQKYQLEQKTFEIPDMRQRMVDICLLPPMLKRLPYEEKMSWRSKLHLAVYFAFFTIYGWIQSWIGGERLWTIDEMIQHFKFPCLVKEPKGCEVWRKEHVNKPDQKECQRRQADYWFAWQRLNGVTRNLIKRTNKVPEKFVPFVGKIENDHPYLDGKTLQQHAERKALYAVDLEDVALGKNGLLAPVALFVEFKKHLMPVAILMKKNGSSQVEQEGERTHKDEVEQEEKIEKRKKGRKSNSKKRTTTGRGCFKGRQGAKQKKVDSDSSDSSDDGTDDYDAEDTEEELDLDEEDKQRKISVYTPRVNLNTDDKMLLKWVQMKMTFNMLEAQYHESITHLGFTHLLMDGVSVCMHATLSYRHPIYKLLRPHFQYMHAINEKAREELLQPGGYVEKDMYIGRLLMLDLIMKHNKGWKYKSIKTEFKSRDVKDIPKYHFRDDALRLEGAIRGFVTKYVTHYYNEDKNLQADKEIQQWHKQLTDSRAKNQGGCGMRGIPEFNRLDNLIDVLTYFIYTCSVEHSATNFPQYEQYAFPPNFAAVLHGDTEQEMDSLNAAMPSRKEMFSTIKIMQVLTRKLTNSLGNYATCYLNAMDKTGRDLVIGFQQDLTDIQKKIMNRNDDIIKEQKNQKPEDIHDYPYEWLLPKNILNSISI